MANLNSDLTLIRESLNQLTKDFEMQGQMAKTFQETFYRLGEMLLELEEHFKQVLTVLLLSRGTTHTRFRSQIRS